MLIRIRVHITVSNSDYTDRAVIEEQQFNHIDNGDTETDKRVRLSVVVPGHDFEIVGSKNHGRKETHRTPDKEDQLKYTVSDDLGDVGI